MHAELPPSIIAEAVLIMAWRFVVFFAPAIAVAVLWWLAFRTDRIINYLFPELRWEHSLGWLNIRAEKRANLALRWLGFAIYILLGAALYGIAWAAVGLQDADQAETNPLVLFDILIRIPVLLMSLSAWVLYLGSWLIPKIRHEREEAGLKRFRAKMAEEEAELERNNPRARSRVKQPLRKPWVNGTQEVPKASASPFGNRDRYWRQPGG